MAPRPDKDIRVARLTARAQERSESALTSARRALIALSNRGLPVSFRTVATEAGVSESYLRKHPALAPEIRALAAGSPRPKPASQPRTPDVASMETKMLVMAERLRVLEAENRTLKSENETLRTEVLNAKRLNRRP